MKLHQCYGNVCLSDLVGSVIMLLCGCICVVCRRLFPKIFEGKKETDGERKKQSEWDEKKQMKLIRVARCLTGNFKHCTSVPKPSELHRYLLLYRQLPSKVAF